MVFEMNLAPAPFEKIRSGSKDVELRLYDEKRRRLNISDEIIFTNLSDKDEQIAVRIKALYRYGSFRELFEEIPPQRCGNEYRHIRRSGRRRHEEVLFRTTGTSIRRSRNQDGTG